MKIVFQHPIALPVSQYGGTERMMFWHMKELVRCGHHVTLIGNAKSKVEEFGINFIPLSQDVDNWAHLVPNNTDVIHLQYNSSCKLDFPIINTIHGNGKVSESFSANSVFVSGNHASNHGAECFVYNALDLSEYPFVLRDNISWDTFLFLAKARWSVKNVTAAISACKKAHKKLHIAGGRYLFPSRYIKGHGNVDNQQKINLIRQCDALLFPVRWPEPFGLAIIEAMSQGIPVIASPYGSLKELITNETGIICKNSQEFLAAILKREKKFDAMTIRKYVEKKFSIVQYSESYLKLYEKIISGKTLNTVLPQSKFENRPENLLPF